MLHLLTTCERSCPHHNKLIRNLLAILAQKNLHLSRRSFHTAAKTIRARLLSYLSYEASRQGSLSFDIPFNRQQLAHCLMNSARCKKNRSLSVIEIIFCCIRILLTKWIFKCFDLLLQYHVKQSGSFHAIDF